MSLNSTKNCLTIFPQVTYINLAIYTISLFCTLSTIFYMSRLLYASKFKKAILVSEISDAMQIYLAVNALCGATSLPYLFYKVIFWRLPSIRGNNPMYSNVLFHFISGIFYSLHYAISSILVFILCLDRYLLINTSNMHWQDNKRINFLMSEIIVLIIVYIGVCASYTFEFPLNYNKVVNCETLSCMQLNLKNYPILVIKTCFGVGNVICCILFIKQLYKLDKETIKKLDNRIIKITVIIEILLNVIPGETNLIYKAFTGIPLATYTGESSYLTFSLELAICSSFYWKKFKAQPKTKTQVTILTKQKEVLNYKK
ncbi:hypothetical protein Mgra_00008092 [Meloidogyne graminicola]|uniref:Uncharacterized protein n=1 Tax=Meloidogyne graminicola TaxID=189291 RepID=A0A8S9ZGX6_9BILA|nr:hypothetical protein Mgra_00008092 [Meloidogyne graminicola]